MMIVVVIIPVQALGYIDVATMRVAVPVQALNNNGGKQNSCQHNRQHHPYFIGTTFHNADNQFMNEYICRTSL